MESIQHSDCKDTIQIGDVFNNWLVIDSVFIKTYQCGSSRRYCKCQCECGTIKEVRVSNLGKSLKCRNCLNKTHGLRNHKLYTVWVHMRERCFYLKDKNYKHYGARGITVCNEWKNNFKEFYDWAMNTGWRKGLTIDRIDNNGNYEPNNCKWSTYKEQNNNQNSNRKYNYNGKMETIAVIADNIGMNQQTLYSRLNSGMTIEEAITKPVQKSSSGVIYEKLC